MKNKRLKEKLLDLFYPPKCMFCKRSIDKYEDYKVCPHCLDNLPYSKNNGCFEVFGGASYLISPLHYTGIVKNALRDLKFRAKYENAALLSRLMINYVQSIDEAKSADAVVSVPLSKKSLLERGFNQTELLAEPLAKAFGIEFIKNALTKVRETKRQSSLSTFAERAQNVMGAFKCNHTLTGKTVLLVDDIYTSGMTAYHCSNELIKSGAEKVIVLTAANAHKDIGVSLHDYKSAHILFGHEHIK